MNNNQLKLNFGEEPIRSCLLITEIKIKKVSSIYHVFTEKKISDEEVRDRLKKGGFTIDSRHGRLNVVPSPQRKQGKFYIADIEFLPFALND
ncbi:hypothetical protein NWP26_10000 [Chrysosporum ovalisporum APH033B]|jgi:hypothetical protein|uniref:hypothetical protein n=1 Tax=Umezakia ovalisporum TaxID=75695 RepID=UPI002474CB04|nr:hypothetical protein [Umezakia ovalisporum]MDH6067580.1 hypothetical protein [Umezakia ovalisporum APH033B]MDH6103246.1 hypothetical protein [Umezakia ovalisporum ANA283AFssAo]